MLNRRQFVGAGVAAAGLVALPALAAGSEKINVIKTIEIGPDIYVDYRGLNEIAYKHICKYLGQQYSDDNKNLVIGPYTLSPSESLVYVRFYNAKNDPYYPDGRLVKAYFYSYEEIIETTENKPQTWKHYINIHHKLSTPNYGRKL